MELVIFQIDVVDDLGYSAEAFALCQPKSLQHCFERAVFSVVSELGFEHVERNRTLNRFSISNEVETRTLIYELFDQP